VAYLGPLSASTAQRRGKFVSRSYPVPAPVDGWDAVSPLADMRPDRAVVLENMFPERGKVRVRGGHASYATGMGSNPIDSLMAWNGPATSKMFAAVGTEIYDVTSSGAVGAADVSSLTNARWQHVNFTTAGGTFLVIANGADNVRNFDGTSWTTPSITVGDSSTFINVMAHKRRLFFVEVDSTSFWYLPVASIAGAAAEFPLGALMDKGGYLMAAGSWTIDGGAGPDDYAVFASSEGQVIVYSGTDPASASTWALVGVYNFPRPIGRRCLQKFGADLVMITEDGIVSLTAAAKLDPSQSSFASLSDRIQDAFKEASAAYKALYGWSLMFYSTGKMALVNIPVAEGATQHQYVMNVLTGAWAKFTGLNANCWETMNGSLFFGGNAGVVYQAESGTSDAGANIPWTMRAAYHDYGRNNHVKAFRMVRPLIQTDGDVTPLIAMNVDYSDDAPTGTATYDGSVGGVYDSAQYDIDVYGGETRTLARWFGIGGEGTVGSIHMVGASSGISVNIIGFDVIYEQGAFI